jgi:transcriptional regulator with XRE-family HTH domain
VRSENTERIRERVLSLIDSEFESDAAFERELSLAEKTVNNWRRGRSSSFMRLLPRLSEVFGVNVGELLDIPLRRDTSELSDEELHLLHLYRKSRTLSPKMRSALRETLEVTINLYIQTAEEQKTKPKSRKRS